MKRRVVVQSETIRLLKALIREELNQIGNIGLSSPGPVGALGGVAKGKDPGDIEYVATWKDEDLMAMLKSAVKDAGGKTPSDEKLRAAMMYLLG